MCALPQTLLQTALTNDISLVGPSTYYGTTDAYRRLTAAGILYKVRPAGASCPRSAFGASIPHFPLRYCRLLTALRMVFRMALSRVRHPAVPTAMMNPCMICCAPRRCSFVRCPRRR